jgi:GxxExxY protein
LFESLYEAIMVYELRKQGLQVVNQFLIPVLWQEIWLEVGFRADIIVNNLVLIELKSVTVLADIHRKQTLTYLWLTNIKLGLFLNFGDTTMRNNIERVANGLKD